MPDAEPQPKPAVDTASIKERLDGIARWVFHAPDEDVTTYEKWYVLDVKALIDVYEPALADVAQCRQQFAAAQSVAKEREEYITRIEQQLTPEGKDSLYWQARALDHATALDNTRAQLDAAETILANERAAAAEYEQEYRDRLIQAERLASQWQATNAETLKTREYWANEADALKAQLAAAHEWREAVSGAIKCAPWFEKGEWGGDKEGWGYHVEMVGWLIREGARLDAAQQEPATSAEGER